MANWKCDCCAVRKLRSDGIVEECAACGAPEHDAYLDALDAKEYSVFQDENEEAKK
jgi:hypothetical protein